MIQLFQRGAAETDIDVLDTGVAMTSASAVGGPSIATAAEEAAVGLWRRAAAGATCDHASVSALMLSAAAAEVVRDGVSYWLWHESRWWRTEFARDQAGRELTLTIPGAEYDGRAPDAREYQSRTVTAPRTAVAGLWWDPTRAVTAGNRPGQTVTRAALLEVESQLRDEFSGPRGSLLPVPGSSNVTGATLVDKLSELKGGVRPVRSTQVAAGLAGGKQSNDWRAERLGATPPAATVTLATQLHNQVLQSYGVPPGLWLGATSAPREAWRFFQQTAVRPLMHLFAEEMSRVLGQAVRIRFVELEHSELQPRARALDSLVKAGIAPERALTLVGLE